MILLDQHFNLTLYQISLITSLCNIFAHDISHDQADPSQNLRAAMDQVKVDSDNWGYLISSLLDKLRLHLVD